MSLTLLSIATSLPDHAIAKRDAAALAASFDSATPGRERTLTSHRNRAIRSRGSVLLDDPGGPGLMVEMAVCER